MAKHASILSGILLLVTGLVSVPGAGCGGKPTASCEQVGAHWTDLSLGTDEIKKQTPDQQKVTRNLLDAMKLEIIKNCKENPQKWDNTLISCVMAATKIEQGEACTQKK